MLGRTVALGTSGLLLGSLLAVASPAHAWNALLWRFDDRPAGFPTSTDPAQTLESARASLEQNEKGRFDARVTLGAAPDASTGTAVRIVLGRTVGADCVADWEQTFPTFDPGGPATRDGSTITIQAALGQVAYDSSCGFVEVASLADGTVLDRLETHDVVTIADAGGGGQSTVKQVKNRTVEPRRWSTVWVQVHYIGDDADGVTVSGAGDGVTVRERTHRAALTWGERVWVPIQVKLRGDRARRVTFVATAFGNGAVWPPEDVPLTVTIRPTR